MRNNKWTTWVQIITSIGTLASVIFFMLQAYYARHLIVRSSEWEKAKMTIENSERFKEGMNLSPLSNSKVWTLGDGTWPDLSTPESWQITDTLRKVFFSLFDNDVEAENELIRLIEVMDAFAYPIIMGYASEEISFLSGMRQFYTYGNFVLPYVFRDNMFIGVHAKLLYRLWRIKSEIWAMDRCKDMGWKFEERVKNQIMSGQELMLAYEEPDFSDASLMKHREKLEKKIKDVQKEIEDYRKKSLK
jgi:hypothetical protein